MANTTTTLDRLYTPQLEHARTRAERHPAVRAIQSIERPELAFAFALEYGARHLAWLIGMQPRLRFAAERCIETRRVRNGRTLLARAHFEGMESQALIELLRRANERWARRGYVARAGWIDRPVSPGVRRLLAVSDFAAAGKRPASCIAMIYEFERLWSCVLAGALRCSEIAGADPMLRTLTSLFGRPDPGSRSLAEELELMLREDADLVTPSVLLGRAGLHAYTDLLEECYRDARAWVECRTTAMPAVDAEGRRVRAANGNPWTAELPRVAGLPLEG